MLSYTFINNHSQVSNPGTEGPLVIYLLSKLPGQSKPNFILSIHGWGKHLQSGSHDQDGQYANKVNTKYFLQNEMLMTFELMVCIMQGHSDDLYKIYPGYTFIWDQILES